MPDSDSVVSGLRPVPYHRSLLAAVADTLTQPATASPWQLSRHVVLLPDPVAAAEFRRELLTRSGLPAVLGLTVTTLKQWLMSRSYITAVLSEPAAELTLVEAIRSHTALFGEDDPWRISTALRQLFDEITLQQVTVPDSFSAWSEQLQQAYGAELGPLQREAEMVFQLWRAWHQQLADSGQQDQSSAYQQALLTDQPPADSHCLLVGIQDFCRAEQRWIEGQLRSGYLQWFYHSSEQSGPATPLVSALLPGIRPPATAVSNPAGEFFDTLFPGDESDFRARAEAFGSRYPRSPLADNYQCLTAASPEQEARAIDIQVRQWLLEGHNHIAVVTEDRRLARRVRALLERAGIDLQDSGGWALSTTTAAGILERWLECLEEDFTCLPLLDLLKSPWLFPDVDLEARLAAVYRLEQDIVLKEKITRSLPRYLQQIGFRLQRLNAESTPDYDRLQQLLDRLARIAMPLQAQLDKTVPAGQRLADLRDSLQQLGIWHGWENDAAGQRLIAQFDSLLAATAVQDPALDWTAFRAWLGGNLERTTFRPAQSGGPVSLLSLAQCQGQHFSALILAACDQRHLPGRAAASPFFNDRVRYQLGLPTWQARHALQLYRFRDVLQAAPRVLFTWHREQQGEPVLASPWLEALLTLHECCYGDRLAAGQLQQLLSADCEVHPALPLPLPAIVHPPRPVIPATLKPGRLSPSSHQRMIDCPYQYFAAEVLRLRAPEPVREALEKSDYGERVHRCLEAFHSPVAGLPGPFRAGLTEANRRPAIALLEQISRRVFARDLEDNFQHRGWLQGWLEQIPAYIDWQIARQRQWRVQATELHLQQTLTDRLTLSGRIDRLDQAGEERAVIDYKTGTSAGTDAVEHGEAVQLPFYALLLDANITEAAYLKLDGTGKLNGARLSGDTLQALVKATRDRLLQIDDALLNQTPLPAWGDAGACRWCDMEGLCRRGAWDV